MIENTNRKKHCINEEECILYSEIKGECYAAIIGAVIETKMILQKRSLLDLLETAVEAQDIV
jgi:hypothetical protein